jgi:shikimate 5-dehydrogenase
LALARAGAVVTLVNRGIGRGRRAASWLGLPFVPLSEFHPAGFAIVVNATTLGRQKGEVPFAAAELERDAVVVDLVYGPRPTDLVSRARESGRVTVDGCEVLLAQARRQFRLMTGRRWPASMPRVASCHHAVPAEAVRTAAPECWSGAALLTQA